MGKGCSDCAARQNLNDRLVAHAWDAEKMFLRMIQRRDEIISELRRDVIGAKTGVIAVQFHHKKEKA